MLKFSSILSMILAILLPLPRSANACSPPPCWPGYFVPGSNAKVPANMPAIYWRPVGDHSGTIAEPDPANVSLYLLGDTETPIALTATKLQYGDFLLAPSTPLIADRSYRLVDKTACSYGSPNGIDITFSTAATSSLPTSLGTLTIKDEGIGKLTVGTASGSCDTDIEAHTVLVKLQPSAAAQPWLQLLHFTTLIDGQSWLASSSILSTYPPGASWEGRGRDRLYRVCQDDGWAQPFPGLPAGKYQVVLEATLPGATVKIQTPPVTVTLACSGEVIPDAGPVTPDGGVEDTGVEDTGVEADAGIVQHDAAPIVQNNSARGCSCSSTDEMGGPSMPAVLVGLLLIFGGLRRTNAKLRTSLVLLGSLIFSFPGCGGDAAEANSNAQMGALCTKDTLDKPSDECGGMLHCFIEGCTGRCTKYCALGDTRRG